MKLAPEKRDRPVVAAVGTAAAAAAAAMVAEIAASAEISKIASIHFRRRGREFGQGWIRTSEGVKPADLQSAPFGHFGTYPCCEWNTGILRPRVNRNCRSLFKKFNDRIYDVLLRFARNLRINRQRQRLARGALRFRKIAIFVTKISKALLLM